MITRGRAAEVSIKYSSLSERHTKLINTTDSEEQCGNATGNVSFVLNISTTTSNDRRSSLV